MSEDQDLRLHEGGRRCRDAIRHASDKMVKRLLALVEEAEIVGVATPSFRAKVGAQLRALRGLRDTLLGTKEPKAEPADAE